MKKLLLVLAASLAANAALVGLYLARSAAPAPAMPSPSATHSTSQAAPGTPFATAEARDLVVQMRASGFPEDIVVAVGQSRLRVEFEARQADIMGFNEPIPPFWDSRARIVLDPSRQKDQRELGLAMNAASKEVLGSDFRFTEDWRASMQRSYGDLPLEKMIQLQEIMQDFSTRRQEVQSPRIGDYSVQLPEDTAKFAHIEQDQQASIVALLTPEQLEEYDLRRSDSARSLRTHLTVFQPTEEEFRTLYKLQRAFDEKYPINQASVALGTDSQRARSLAQQQLKEDMAKALSPDRTDFYRLATEPGASNAARILDRLNLPMSTIDPVLSVQKEIQAKAASLRTDRTLPAATRNQALVALQQQANDRITSLLGADGLAAYNISNSWIQSLAPPPPARAGTPAPGAPVLPR